MKTEAGSSNPSDGAQEARQAVSASRSARRSSRRMVAELASQTALAGAPASGSPSPSTRAEATEPSILVVEDDPAIATALHAGLGGRGYVVTLTSCGEDGLRAIADERPAVIVLDLGLPDIDGVEMCRRVRTWTETPIIVVTADGAEDRKIEALDAGADDYITKPFSMRELEARLRVALRHHARQQADLPVVQIGDLIIDLVNHAVTVGGRRVDLTPTEFDMLAVLARHPGRVLTHATILREVWGPEGRGHVEYLRVYARAIRAKLGDNARASRLVTEPGIGYRLIDPTSFTPPLR